MKSEEAQPGGWQVVPTETTVGKVLLVEHGAAGDPCFGDHHVELAETTQALHCATDTRVYEEVVLSVVRSSRDQVVSAVLRREQADVAVVAADGLPRP